MNAPPEIDESQVQVLWNAWLDAERQVVVEEFTFVPLDRARFDSLPQAKRKEHPVGAERGQDLQLTADDLVRRLEQQARALIMATLFPSPDQGQ